MFGRLWCTTILYDTVPGFYFNGTIIMTQWPNCPRTVSSNFFLLKTIFLGLIFIKVRISFVSFLLNEIIIDRLICFEKYIKEVHVHCSFQYNKTKPNHIYCTCTCMFEEFYLWVHNSYFKSFLSGGIICLSCRIEHLREALEYAKFFPLCDQMERDGKWRKEEVTTYNGYLKNVDGVIIVYRVL